MAGAKLRGADTALPTMQDHADEVHPMDRPSAAQVGGNTAKNATGKPFQQKMIPESADTTIRKQAGAVIGGITSGWDALNSALKRKP